MNDYSCGFMPLCGENPRVLILGSFPSVTSIDKNEYYGNKHNHFWKIMEAVAGVDINQSYEDRILLLFKKGIALWDVVSGCRREGSSDSTIKNEVINDIPWFIQENKSIKAIVLNGKSGAGRLFQKKFKDFNTTFPEIDIIILPSTSSANAIYRPEDKIAQWSVIKKYLDK